MIGEILSNEKYTGNSTYERNTGAEYPAMKRFRNIPVKVSRLENHHVPIIDRDTFDLVQELKKEYTNIEVDEHENKVRKSTHYSMKQTGNKAIDIADNV